uniref:Ig-like domain-containing protein n=1 Tax=Anabas testudineus TaxID=64144 RepID=A0A3Q1HIH1_ANATE
AELWANKRNHLQINLTAEPGDTVTLPCYSRSTVTAVKWIRPDLKKAGYVFMFQDGRSVPDNQHPYYKNWVELKDTEMKNGDVSLILKNVTTSDSGTYECYVNQGQINLRRGPFNEDGGDKDGGKSGGHEDRNSRGHVGLAIGLSVTVLVLVVAFMFFIRLKRTRQSPNSAPADLFDVS